MEIVCETEAITQPNWTGVDGLRQGSVNDGRKPIYQESNKTILWLKEAIWIRAGTQQ